MFVPVSAVAAVVHEPEVAVAVGAVHALLAVLPGVRIEVRVLVKLLSGVVA